MVRLEGSLVDCRKRSVISFVGELHFLHFGFMHAVEEFEV